jgi:gas vesicle protein
MEELMPSKNFGMVGFLIGFATGSVVSLLYAPKSGSEFRTNLRKDFPEFLKKAEEIRGKLIIRAKSIASDISEKSEKFVETSKKLAEGRYSGAVDAFEKELFSIKHAINSAVNNYKISSELRRSTSREVDDLFIDFENEVLPKFVGMRKRKR